MSDRFWRLCCLGLAGLVTLAGCAGMLLSFMFLGSSNPADIAAGQAGFVAGAVLIGSGLVSLTLLVSRGVGMSGERERRFEEADRYPVEERRATGRDITQGF
jgi:hypothetical protein